MYIGMMPENKPLWTSDLAKAVGVHPNTVRLYEKVGLLQSPPRSRTGYRQFSPLHLEQIRLVLTALRGQWPGPAIRKSAVDLIRLSASGEYAQALALARRHLRLVRHERGLAEEAARYLERWASGCIPEIPSPHRNIRATALLLELTSDTLRNWERDGLVKARRNAGNRYREYGSREIGRLKVIRLLTRAGYSHMSILRMLRQLDAGERGGLRAALDTPHPDDDIVNASDRWLSSLAEQEDRARAILRQVRKITRLAGGK